MDHAPKAAAPIEGWSREPGPRPFEWGVLHDEHKNQENCLEETSLDVALDLKADFSWFSGVFYAKIARSSSREGFRRLCCVGNSCVAKAARRCAS